MARNLRVNHSKRMGYEEEGLERDEGVTARMPLGAVQMALDRRISGHEVIHRKRNHVFTVQNGSPKYKTSLKIIFL